MSRSENNGDGRARWASLVVTLLLAGGAMTIQWGVVTTKLQQLEKRMDEFLGEARTIRGEYQAMERRVAFLEGRVSALPAGKGNSP